MFDDPVVRFVVGAVVAIVVLIPVGMVVALVIVARRKK